MIIHPMTNSSGPPDINYSTQNESIPSPTSPSLSTPMRQRYVEPTSQQSWRQRIFRNYFQWNLINSQIITTSWILPIGLFFIVRFALAAWSTAVFVSKGILDGDNGTFFKYYTYLSFLLLVIYFWILVFKMLWTLGISILRPRNIFRAHYDFSVPKHMDGQSHERAKRNEHRHQSSAASISAVAPTHTLPQPSPIHSVHSTRGDAVQYADNVQLRRLQVQERSPSTTFDWRASFESGVDRHPNVNPAGWFDRFIWVLHTTVATNALVIVIVVYCVLVFFWDGTEEGADPTPLWITIHVHGLNLVMMAIEISLSRFVWVWSHTFWPSMFMLLYLFFSWIYYGATGEWIYPILDWHDAAFVGYYILVFVILILCFTFWWAVSKLRDYLSVVLRRVVLRRKMKRVWNSDLNLMANNGSGAPGLIEMRAVEGGAGIAGQEGIHTGENAA